MDETSERADKSAARIFGLILAGLAVAVALLASRAVEPETEPARIALPALIEELNDTLIRVSDRADDLGFEFREAKLDLVTEAREGSSIQGSAVIIGGSLESSTSETARISITLRLSPQPSSSRAALFADLIGDHLEAAVEAAGRRFEVRSLALDYVFVAREQAKRRATLTASDIALSGSIDKGVEHRSGISILFHRKP